MAGERPDTAGATRFQWQMDIEREAIAEAVSLGSRPQLVAAQPGTERLDPRPVHTEVVVTDPRCRTDMDHAPRSIETGFQIVREAQAGATDRMQTVFGSNDYLGSRLASQQLSQPVERDCRVRGRRKRVHAPA